MDTFSLSDGSKIDLDAAEFDPTDAVNRLLGLDPDPEEVFELIEAIQTQIELNDEEILSVLRTQGQRASKSHQELISAKAGIGELHGTMGQILEEANQTQTKVDVICKDIRAMDHAKRNLTQSISILENFGTLTDALNDLKETSNDREKYAENASKLDSVLCLMDRFEKYHDVPKVATFRDMVELITRNLHQQIIREFQLLWIVSDPFAAHFSVSEGTSFEERSRVASQQEKRLQEAKPKFQAMRDAALVATALERRTQCKTSIIEDIMASWMTNLRATKLELERDRSMELCAQLEGVFSWLRDILEENKYFVEQWKVFPEDWQVRKEVALRFCTAVEPYITMVLQDWDKASEGEDAEGRSSVLLQAWGATRTFEKHLMALVEGLVGTGAQDSGYEAAKRRARNVTSGQAAQNTDTSKSVFDGRLRSLFSPHLAIVVAWHTKTLSTAMNLLIEQDESNGWRSAAVARAGGVSSGATRLDSARALILECRSQAEASLPVLCQSVDSVVSFAEVICNLFQAYCERLTQVLPPIRMDQRRSVESCDLPLERAPAVCTCIMTAAYIKDNIPLLQRFIIDRCIADTPKLLGAAQTKDGKEGGGAGGGSKPGGTLDGPPTLGTSLHSSSKRFSEKDKERNEEEARWERVTLEPAIRVLESLEASALKVLDVGLMTQLTKYIDGPLLPGPGIQVMAANAAAWRLEQTGDTSSYATSISAVLSKWGGVLYQGLVPASNGPDVDDAAFDHICSKLASKFIPYITSHGIFKLRRMNDGALTQLAIDLSVIKDALSKFPAEAYMAARPSATYPKGFEAKLAAHKELIETKLSAAVTLVKVLQITDNKQFVTTYSQLLEQPLQHPEAVQQCLALLDISKDVAVTRINMFRSLGNNSGFSMRPQAASAQLPGGQLGDLGNSALSGNMLSAASTWAANAQANMLNYKTSAVFGGMSTSLLSGADSKSFISGTKELAAKSKDFMGKFRGKFGTNRGSGSSGK